MTDHVERMRAWRADLEKAEKEARRIYVAHQGRVRETKDADEAMERTHPTNVKYLAVRRRAEKAYRAWEKSQRQLTDALDKRDAIRARKPR